MAIRNRGFVRGFRIGIMAMIMMTFFQVVSGFGSVIVESGKPNAAIIATDNAPDSVRLAASELQSYVEKVTGARLPIQKEPIPQGMPGVNLFLGESSFTKALGLNLEGLKSDGFKIVGQDNWLAILGRDYQGKPIEGSVHPYLYAQTYNARVKIGVFGETGTLYGVYRFLEDYCGIRWYLPGELGTVIPKMETIRVEKVNYQKSPDFEFRYAWFCDLSNSDEGARWFRRVGFGGKGPVQIVHSFYFLSNYESTHPEYFALIGGQRDFINRYLSVVQAPGVNLCLSNPDLIKQWAADIGDYFDKNPEQTIYPVMPMDGMTKICECPNCQKKFYPLSTAGGGQFSNPVWYFINEIAKEVYKTHPDKLIGCCAYERYRLPPTNITTLSPNVVVMHCQVRARYNDKRNLEHETNRILGWRQLKPNSIYVWEYYEHSWWGWEGLPVAYTHLTSDNLRLLKGISKGEFIEAESESNPASEENLGMSYPGMQHVDLYVTAKLYWDSSLDVDQLMNEYYEKFYGPAREEMKGFWTTVEEIWMTALDGTKPDGQLKEEGWGDGPRNVYTKDKFDKLSSFLEKAYLKTPENSIYRKRVELINSEFGPARAKLRNVLGP